MAVQGRTALDAMTCAMPDCDCGDELYMHSRCHPGLPTWAVYSHGVLRIECADPDCKKLICEIAVHDDTGLAPDGPPDLG